MIVPKGTPAGIVGAIGVKIGAELFVERIADKPARPQNKYSVFSLLHRSIVIRQKLLVNRILF